MIKYKITKQENKEIVLEKPGEYVVELMGEGAEAKIDGVFVGEGEVKIEVKVTVIHKVGNTRAETVLKGVGKDKSMIRFDGKIVVEKNCPKVNSFLTEKILLVGEGARAEAVPDLEIESDEVKCSHAATVSRIPEEQLFYLMSRGVSREKAEELVVEGFLVG